MNLLKDFHDGVIKTETERVKILTGKQSYFLTHKPDVKQLYGAYIAFYSHLPKYYTEHLPYLFFPLLN